MSGKDRSKYIHELEEKINSLEEIIAMIPGHIYWKDRDGRLLGCNDEQARYVGLKSRNDIVGLMPIDLIDRNQPEQERIKQAEAISRADKEVMVTNKLLTIEEFAIRADGSPGIYLSQKAPLHDKDGNVSGLVGVTLDITTQKEIEKKLKEMSKTKTRMIVDVISLVRGILNSTIGSAQILERTKLTNKQMRCLELILDGNNKIIPTLNRLKDYIELESGNFEVINDKFKLKDFFEETVYDYKKSANAKDLELTLSFEENLPVYIEGAKYYISQILRNLLKNAVRYTSIGSVTVHVEKQNISDKEVKLIIDVADTGQGIREKMLKNIFKLFENQDNNEEFVHAGLDLSISARIIKLLRGEIKIDSKIGQGTIFTLEVPFRIVSESEWVAKQGYVISDEGDYEIKLKRSKDSLIKVLIVEDEAISQHALKMMLEEEYNCDISFAYTVKQAKALLVNQYDLCLIDMNLPDGTGIEVIQEVRNRYKDIDIPIIAITTHVSEEQKEKINEFDTTDIIEKPVDLNILTEVIDYYVFQEHDDD